MIADPAITVLTDLVAGPVAIIDPTGIILQANTRFAASFGIGRSSCEGAGITELLGELPQFRGLASRLPALIEEACSNRAPAEMVLPVVGEEGEVGELVVTLAHPSATHQEQPGSTRSRSASRSALTPATQSAHCKEFFSEALQAAGAGVWRWHLETNDVAWSAGMWDLLDLEESGATPSVELWTSVMEPGHRNLALQAITGAVERLDDLAVTYPILLRDGAIRWIQSRGRPIFNEKGEPEAYIGTAFDITDMQEQQQQLLAHKARTTYALNAAQAGIWEWEVEEDRLMWSEQMWGLYGLEVDSCELNHQLCVTTVHPDDREAVKELITAAAMKESAASVTFRVLHPDGSLHWLHSQAQPIFDVDGKLTRYIGILSDVTDRQRTETALAETNLRLSQALEAAHAGVWEWNVRSGKNTWSDEIWPLYGIDRAAGEPTFELWAASICPEDRQHAISSVQKAAAEGSELLVQYRVCYPNGSRRWLLSRGKPIRDYDGQVQRYIGTIIDITEQKNLEEELKRKEARLEFALDATSAGTWEWDLNEDAVEWSERVWKLYGLEPESQPHDHKLCQSTVHPDDREHTFKEVMEAASRDEKIDIEFRVHHPADGSEHWLACKGLPLMDENGSLGRYIGTVMDITERKKLDDILRENEAKFRAIFEHSPIAISISELESGSIVDVNASWCRLLGYSRDRALTATERKLGLHTNADECREIAQAARNHERITNRPLLLFDAGGELVDVLYSTEFIELQGQSYLLAMMVDITIEKVQQQNINRLEQSVADRNIELKREIERLHRFMNMISHEYRTPLAIMRTNLDLVKMKNKRGDYANTPEFSKIERAIARLVEVLEGSIRECRESESGRSINKSPISMLELVQTQIETFAKIWKERNIEFRGSTSQLLVHGEPSEMKFVIFNLLDNARKYSPPTATVGVEASVEEGQCCITFTNPMAVPCKDEEIPLFFEKYHRGANAANTSGAGLGLWLVANIVEQHGGTIEISRRNDTIAVRLCLPCLPDEPAQA